MNITLALSMPFALLHHPSGAGTDRLVQGEAQSTIKHRVEATGVEKSRTTCDEKGSGDDDLVVLHGLSIVHTSRSMWRLSKSYSRSFSQD